MAETLTERAVTSDAALRCEVRARVLFADDSPAQRTLAVEALGGAFDVTAVADGREVLLAVRAGPPDAVVCDLQMPALGGLDVLRLLKRDPALRRIPFILVTGEQLAAVRSVSAGADDYLTKPYGAEELCARVTAAVRTYRMYTELERQHVELLRVHAASRRLEVELRQSQKLEAVGRLAAGIAHEINTPIQFIGDNTRFLEEAFLGLAAVLDAQSRLIDELGAPPQALERLAREQERADLSYLLEQVPGAVRRTLEGVQRVATIVRAMKEFAHPDQKEMVATDLNRALQATLDVARNEYKYVADVETAFGDLPPVLCHAGDLNQVFLNVIVNAAHAIADAVKATGGKGLIRVATAPEAGGVHVAVSDTGGGIPEAVRDKIYDPFFTTKEVGRGSGQGLAIARSIVEKHGGTIDFDTAAGRGTTFHIRLPLDPPHRAPAEAP